MDLAVLVPVIAPSGRVGGMENMASKITGAFIEHGHRVQVVSSWESSDLRETLPDRAELVPLLQPEEVRIEPDSSNQFIDYTRYGIHPLDKAAEVNHWVLPLKSYLQHKRPSKVLSCHRLMAFAVEEARRRLGAHEGASFSHFIRECNSYSLLDPSLEKYGEYYKAQILRYYPHAQGLLFQCDGLRQSFEKFAGRAFKNSYVVGNPLIGERELSALDAPVDHKWFSEGAAEKVIVGIGRLGYQKNFEMLIRAFSQLYATRSDTRLLLLGEGSMRQELEGIVQQLGLSSVVDMPGKVSNPIAYARSSSLVVSSSLFEGLQGSLVEALFSGANLIATDCESGAREVLDGGRFGTLVEVNDIAAMVEAMAKSLKNEISSSEKIEQARFALKHFGSAEVFPRYIRILEEG